MTHHSLISETPHAFFLIVQNIDIEVWYSRELSKFREFFHSGKDQTTSLGKKKKEIMQFLCICPIS